MAQQAVEQWFSQWPDDTVDEAVVQVQLGHASALQLTHLPHALPLRAAVHS
jgi:hypothetical protein